MINEKYNQNFYTGLYSKASAIPTQKDKTNESCVPEKVASKYYKNLPMDKAIQSEKILKVLD